MKVEILRMPKMTIEEFAEQHNLELVITERSTGTFTARFKHTGWGGPPYSMPQSNGPERSTIQNAVAAYAEAISGVALRRADGKGAINVPSLTVAGFYE